VATAGLLVHTQSATPAQGPSSPVSRPTFRAGTDVVQVDVSVLDKNRKPVLGLTAADFTVLEDGKPRPVVAFTPVELPEPDALPASPAAAWTRDIGPDVTTNAVAEEGRLVVIMFDRSIRFQDQALARRIAVAAVNELGPNDLAAVVFANPFANAGTRQDFTSNHALLLEAIRRPMARALILPEFIDIRPIDPLPGFDRNQNNGVTLDDPEGYQSGECYCGACALESMTRVADLVRPVPGRRKSLLYISTYFRGYEDLNFKPMVKQNNSDDRGKCSGHLEEARQKMVRAAGLANLTIHVLDPVGAVTPESNPSSRDPIRIKQREENLHLPADHTGGRTVVNTNAPDAQVPAIFDESHSYYLLGFEPADAVPNGKFHTISVKVARRGVSLRTRTGYYASATAAPDDASMADSSEPAAAAAGPAASVASSLAAVMDGVLPIAGWPLDLSAAAFAGAGREATVALTIGTRDVPPAPGGDSSRMNLLIAAFDRSGRSVASRRQTTMMSAGAGPRDIRSRLDLTPGRYQIRVAAEAAGRNARVDTYVEIPDFAGDPLSMSGPVIEAEPSWPAPARDPAIDVLPEVPTTRREFDRMKAAR
jgi:VWFA-related protein